jgi:hypothetical protein
VEGYVSLTGRRPEEEESPSESEAPLNLPFDQVAVRSRIAPLEGMQPVGTTLRAVPVLHQAPECGRDVGRIALRSGPSVALFDEFLV